MPCIFCDQTRETVDAVEALNEIVQLLGLSDALKIDPATGKAEVSVVGTIDTSASQMISGHVRHLIDRANYAETNERRAKKALRSANNDIYAMRAEIEHLKSERINSAREPSFLETQIDPDTPGLKEYQQQPKTLWGVKKDAWVHTRWDGLKARQKKW